MEPARIQGAETTAMAEKTIQITGVSSGLGKALAEEALRQGWRVVGTVRQEEARKDFEAIRSGRAFGRILDVREMARMAEVVGEIEESVGPVDVLVNNAGYGLAATIEEAPLEEVREQFEVNVFGQIAMLQAVLPHMRKRRSGRILNMTSMGGLMTFPGVGIYNSTKFAMEGVTEALRQEVAEFGILVTAIEPGLFQTNWAGSSLRSAPGSIQDYNAQREARGKQEIDWGAGDPVKAAEAMLTILADPKPPGHLLLGSIADELVGKKLDTLRSEIEKYRALTASADTDRQHPQQ